MFGAAALKPRKPPKQDRSKETVDAIFEAALQMLDRSTNRDVSVQAIAERAGVSVGSLYQYFPSKQALLSALIGVTQRRAIANIERDLESVHGLPGQQAAERLVANLVECATRRQGIELSLVRYFCRVGDLETLTAEDDRLIRAVERYIRSLGDQVRPVDPALAAFLVCNALRSAVVLTLVQNPARLREANFSAELVQLVVRYLSA